MRKLRRLYGYVRRKRHAKLIYTVFLFLICLAAFEKSREGTNHSSESKKSESISFRPITKISTKKDIPENVKKVTKGTSKKEVNTVSITKKALLRIFRPNPRRTVQVATTVCRGRLQEVNALVKSILMFSGRRIEFHIFAEEKLQESLKTQLDKVFSGLYQNFKYTIYDLWFPKKNDREWKSMWRPCSSQRLFVPSVLKTYDAVIYLDSDSLVLNSIYNLWGLFENFKSSQMVGVTLFDDATEGMNYSHDAKFPVFGELGISNGIMLMNLTRMRQFSFVQKIVKIHDQWKNSINYGDRDLLNILFHDYPDLIYVLPCEWHYRPKHCYLGNNTCTSAFTNGVNLIHGERQAFHRNHAQAFRAIYDVISQFDFEKDKMNRISQMIEERVLKHEKGPCAKMLTSFVKNVRRLHPVVIMSP